MYRPKKIYSRRKWKSVPKKKLRKFLYNITDKRIKCQFLRFPIFNIGHHDLIFFKVKSRLKDAI